MELVLQESNSRSEVYYVKRERQLDKYKPSNNWIHNEYYRGFVVWLSELFSELNIPYKSFRNSLLIEVKNEVISIFQHQKNKLWFYFGDKFKARNFRNFIKRIKKFLMETLGKFVVSIIEKYERIMFNELGELIEYQKSKQAKLTLKKCDNYIIYNFFGIFELIIKPLSSKLEVKVNKELYQQHKEKIFNVIKKLFFISLPLLSISNKRTNLYIRFRPSMFLI